MHGGDIYRNKVNMDFSVNVNPLGIPESVKEAIHNAVDKLNRYPDPISEELTKELSKKHIIPSENIVVANGASEIFMSIVHGIRPRKALLLAPSFIGYKVALKAIDCEIKEYYLKEANGFDISEDFINEIASDIDIIFLATPNNPTGSFIEDELLFHILDKAKLTNTYVVLDECFIEFTEFDKEQRTNKILDYPNAIVVRAFTKAYAIPGIRLGYAYCRDVNFVNLIKKNIPEWSVSYLAQVAGIAALNEKDYIDKSVLYIEEERKYLTDELIKMGIKIYPSKANFLLIKSDIDLYSRLLEEGILIRRCDDYTGLGKCYFRIAIKSHDENVSLCDTIKRILP